MIQKTINYIKLEELIKDKKAFVTCGKREIGRFHNIFENVVYFCNFTPNPKYEEVVEGIKAYKENNCDIIIAIGGGSAIDVAKCIKLYKELDENENYLTQKVVPNETPLIAIPTTAGSGSEATRYAVIYKDGVKQSITHDSILPKYVIYDERLLDTLPTYQRISTVLDTISHSIESIWSIGSTEESREYAKKSIELNNKYMYKYINGNNEYNKEMFEASMYAGRAINITRTTAGHSLCYKLTTLYGIAHGHAAALINSELYPYMLEKVKDEETINKFKTIAKLYGYDNLEESVDFLRKILKRLDLYNVNINPDDIELLVKSVNIERLNNNPIKLEANDIEEIYCRIIRRIKR